MPKILVTGATGNVGSAVLKILSQSNLIGTEVLAGVREVNSAKIPFDFVKQVGFDFGKPESFVNAFQHIDTLFLLRPPQLADVKKYFEPLIEAVANSNIKHIVFLSVQGAEKSAFIPHHKIEKKIIASGISYTFLRPGYFMQNLTTTLKKDLIEKKQIFLPAGNAKFNWIDVEDISIFAAKVLLSPADYKNQAYEITGTENVTFTKVAEIISTVSQTEIKYISPNLLRFFLRKRREGVETSYILVMILLHYLPRFMPEPHISRNFEHITGKKPKSLQHFISQSFPQVFSLNYF